MKIDWDKARLLAAKRFEDIIMACNNHDENAIRDCMESGIAWSSKEYMLEDDDMKLDDNGRFIYKGYTCQVCRCTECHKLDGYDGFFYVCRVAIHTATNAAPYWYIIPYMLYSIPSDSCMNKCTGLLSAINEATADMIPATHEEMEKYELV